MVSYGISSSIVCYTELTQERNSDPAVKQLILSIDERSRFIILDLDDTHLLISPERIDWLRTELEMEVRIFLLQSLSPIN